MSKKISEKKLVKPKEVNFSKDEDLVDQEVKQKVSKKCQNVIDLLTLKQNDPNFVDKCKQIIEIIEENNGQGE